MALWEKLKFWSRPAQPLHLERGRLGERAAREYLQKSGLLFLTSNFAGRRGEVDLIFRDGDCLVFVEVKTRSTGSWTRPGRAVDNRKRLALARTAGEYLRLLKHPPVAYRFDVVEVLLENGVVGEIKHLPNSFNSTMIRRGRR